MPVIPALTRSIDGFHRATIKNFEYKSSASNDNPMIVVELALDQGDLVNAYVMVTQGGEHIQTLLHACGEYDVAARIRRKENPSFELDDLIERRVHCEIYRGLVTRLSQ